MTAPWFTFVLHAAFVAGNGCVAHVWGITHAVFTVSWLWGYGSAHFRTQLLTVDSASVP